MAEDSAEVTIDSELFYKRLERLQSDWTVNKSSIWGSADAIVIPFGAVSADDGLLYSKSSSFHLYLLQHELPNSIIVMTRNNFCFMGSAKMCRIIDVNLKDKNPTFNVQLFQRTKDEGMNREYFNALANVIRKGGGSKIGSVFKGEYNGNFIKTWMDFVDQSNLDKVELSAALGYFFAVKDETELVSSCSKQLYKLYDYTTIAFLGRKSFFFIYW